MTPASTTFKSGTVEFRDSGGNIRQAEFPPVPGLPGNFTVNILPTMSSGSHNTHARLSPSSSKRWTTCTASIKYIEENATRLPEDRSSVYAEEGTKAHDYAAELLEGMIDHSEIPTDFLPHVRFYVDHCRGMTQPGDDVYIESKVPLFYSPEDTGTADFAIVREGEVIIRDLKYGAGVLVEAEENSQLAIYALSFIRSLQADGLFDFPPDTVVDLGIVQPRHHAEDPVRTWILTLHDLETYCRDIEYAAVQIQENRGLKFEPSEDGCRWCPCKAFCSHRAAALVEPLGADGIDFLASLPDLGKDDKKLPAQERMDKAFAEAASGVDATAVLDDETLVALYARSKAISSWLDDIAGYLKERAESGDPVPGTKLVEGRQGNRAWADEEAADKLLAGKLKQGERYNFKLISPTQAEKILDLDKQSSRFKNLFTGLVTRSDGQPVLALESDKRPAITAAVDVLPDLDNP